MMAEKPCGIQVVSAGPEHTFTLEEEALARLVGAADVRERAAVVISVAGAFRKGKSFLLDFFLRYLHHKYGSGGGSDWLGTDDEPLQGFSWRGGSERDTTGILMWPEIFNATLDNGEKVAIVLLDTQGAFDSESTVRDCATVFALSTMLSSVQIYNLSQNIEEDDLQHLQLFTEYGRLAQQGLTGVGKPFQRLQLLVRDWSFPYEYPYGGEGGRHLLKKRLEIHEGQHEELRALRKHIASSFEDIGCFLMPHPGLTVATRPHFDGRLSDIDTEFKDSLRELVPSLLALENLVLKKINGQILKAKDLPFYFKAYMNIFNSSELPEPKTILEATAEANNLSAVANAKDVYTSLMEEVCGGAKPYLRPTRLEDEHNRARDKAVHVFTSTAKMGGEALSEKYKDQLLEELEEQYTQLRSHNNSKNLLNLVGAPAVFATLAVLGILLAMAAAAGGMHSVAVVGQASALAAVVCLLVWGYTRVSGNMREVGAQLDDAAAALRDYIVTQAWNNLRHRPAIAEQNVK